MKCERCDNEHDGSFGSGRFCNRACANAREIKYKDGICTKCGNNVTIPVTFGHMFDVVCEECKKKTQRIKKPPKQCICCGKECKKNAQKYCSLGCKNEYEYLIYINKWKLGIEDGCSGKSGTSVHIRRYMFEKHNSTCQKCGWGVINEHTGKIPLTLHHVDGKHKNNKEGNLELICPNCHCLTENYGSRNIGNG